MGTDSRAEASQRRLVGEPTKVYFTGVPANPVGLVLGCPVAREMTADMRGPDDRDLNGLEAQPVHWMLE